jgi:hypothetical protein
MNQSGQETKNFERLINSPLVNAGRKLESAPVENRWMVTYPRESLRGLELVCSAVIRV